MPTDGELYHVDQDFAELTDLASAQPTARRGEGRERENTPFTLDDRKELGACRRTLRNKYDHPLRNCVADMARIDRLSAPDISDRAYTVTASFEADRTWRVVAP